MKNSHNTPSLRDDAAPTPFPCGCGHGARGKTGGIRNAGSLGDFARLHPSSWAGCSARLLHALVALLGTRSEDTGNSRERDALLRMTLALAGTPDLD